MAEKKDGIEAAARAWASAFSEPTPASLLQLYAPDGVLWGTTASVRYQGTAIAEYFGAVFARTTERSVTFSDPLVRHYGEVAINTGRYDFSWIENGQQTQIPARYSFVYRRTDQAWLIVDHHSSVLPQ